MKRKRLGRAVAFLLTVVFVLSMFCGCGKDSYEKLATPVPAVSTPADTPVTLWVVTEKSREYGMMNYLLENVVKAYGEANKNVTFEIEDLPNDVEEREVRLESIRAEIMAGKGPDVYLLPSVIPLAYDNEELFSDVELSMYNGVFHEISAYYNADDDLKKEELNTKVMDAGTIGESRYILPLRYNFPVVLVDEERLSEYDITVDDVTNIQRLMDKLLEIGDPELAYSANMGGPDRLYSFPKLIDYRNKEILLTEEQLAAYMRQYQQWRFLQAEESLSEDSAYIGGSDIKAYVSGDAYWGHGDYALHIDDLTTVLHSTLIAKSLGESYSMYPLRSSDDSLIANITYWGAVGSGCEYPDVAYDFLREFLSREAQWETTRGEAAIAASGSLYENGVPVRNKGAIPHLGESIKEQSKGLLLNADNGSALRDEVVQLVELEAGDIPVWEAEVDIVRFNHPLTAEELMAKMNKELNDFENGFAPKDTDVDALAEEYLKKLEYLLAEG